MRGLNLFAASEFDGDIKHIMYIFSLLNFKIKKFLFQTLLSHIFPNRTQSNPFSFLVGNDNKVGTMLTILRQLLNKLAFNERHCDKIRTNSTQKIELDNRN